MTVAILGYGLMGAALAKALRTHDVAEQIVAFDPNPAHREYGLASGRLDAVFAAPAEAACDADLVVLAAPVGAMGELARAIAPALKPGTVVTDLGSIKGAVMQAVTPLLPASIAFVPGHPIAGTEASGPFDAPDDLFAGKRVILTPDAACPKEAVARIEALWRSVGAVPERMDASTHDRIYAAVSHLPQAIALAMKETLDAFPAADREGLEPFLRLTGSNPVLWEEIFRLNADALVPLRTAFRAEVERLHAMDAAALAHAFADAAHLRATLPPVAMDNADTPLYALAWLLSTALLRVIPPGALPYAGSGLRDFTAPLCGPPPDMTMHAIVIPLVKILMNYMEKEAIPVRA